MPPQRRTDWLERSKLLSCLRAMRGRCYNEEHPGYQNYGARGIRICEEWLGDRETFIAWAYGAGYSVGLEIDRRDNDGDYTPNNCRWVKEPVQARNRRIPAYMPAPYKSEAVANSNKRRGFSKMVLTAEAVIKARQEFEASGNTMDLRPMAAELNVAYKTLWQAVTRRSWRHL